MSVLSSTNLSSFGFLPASSTLPLRGDRSAGPGTASMDAFVTSVIDDLAGEPFLARRLFEPRAYSR
jgi:hypothetical protein